MNTEVNCGILRRQLAVGILAVGLQATTLRGQGEGHSSTITVDFATRTISPANPTMNIKANSSVVLEIRPSTRAYLVVPSASLLAPEASDFAKKADDYPSIALDLNSFVDSLRDNPANADEALKRLKDKLETVEAAGTLAPDQVSAVKKKAQAAAAASKDEVRSGSLTIINFDEHKRCPANLVLKPGVPPLGKDGQRCDDWSEPDNIGKSWLVHLADRGARDYSILIDCADREKDGKNPCGEPITVPLHIENAVYAPFWGAGFSFTSLRDQRVRLDRNPADSETLLLRRLQHDDSTPTQVAAYLHYCFVRYKWEWLCPFNAGLATDLKESVQIMAGPGFRIRSLPLVNSAYLTVGPVYGSRKVLNDDYVGRRAATVPATTTAASLLRTERSLGAFVGLSFGFFGSEEKFTGVYAGKKAGTETASKAD